VLPRALVIPIAAAALYAGVLVTTGSVEITYAGGSVGGRLFTMAVDVPIVAPSTEELLGAPAPAPVGEEPAPVVSPSPPAAPPPSPDIAPQTSEPEPAAVEPPPPAGEAQRAEAPDAVAREAPHDQARPSAEPHRARPGANSEARVGDLRRSARRRHDRSSRAASGPHRHGAPAVYAPAPWLAAPVAPIAIPDFVIDGFRIPPFLLPIYQAAGMQYGVSWQVLAAINQIETDYGRNLNVSSAGALGWMQFMPATWQTYGVDANADGTTDPFNPADAIFAAARYLHAAGWDTNPRAAIFAYNHATWYVDAVVGGAEAISRLPSDLVDSLAGLARGRFPVDAPATYAIERSGRGDRPGIEIVSRPGAPAIAVNDGLVVRAGRSERLGRFVRLRDVYGNRYTYAHLGHVARVRGARVSAGATLGRLGRGAGGARPRLRFEIRPSGRAPYIDPEPILDGWRLLDSTAIQLAERSNPYLRSGAGRPTLGQIVLMSEAALTRRVLADPDVVIYECGRADVRSGRIDRRILATIELLAASGLAPTVSSLQCGHGYLTASGNVSEHSTGSAVDISAINGVPIAGHQGPGSVTDVAIRRLLALQGTMKPHQIISLMTFAGADNTFAMGDHADHIHVGFRAAPDGRPIAPFAAGLEPRQWTRLIDRIGRIDAPVVRRVEPE
jgi:hypothetical protein